MASRLRESSHHGSWVIGAGLSRLHAVEVPEDKLEKAKTIMVHILACGDVPWTMVVTCPLFLNHS